MNLPPPQPSAAAITANEARLQAIRDSAQKAPGNDLKKRMSIEPIHTSFPSSPSSPEVGFADVPDAKRSRGSPAPFGPGSPELSAWSFADDVDPTDFWKISELSPKEPMRLALEELGRYIAEFLSGSTDKYWHRRSGKPVLAVIACSSADDEEKLVLYRGMNTEVSLPCGSLCAERAAIARAASAFQPARTLKAIAVVDPSGKVNPLWPCEVCQSWIAKLRVQNPLLGIAAVNNLSCDEFLWRVDGELKRPQCFPFLSLPDCPEWMESVRLVEGITEFPWEAKELVYLDGAWTFMHSAQQNILRAAASRGTHVLVGVHSDQTLKQECGSVILENLETRSGRLLQNRHVHSVLLDAPWQITRDMIQQLRIRKVLRGSVSKTRDMGRKGNMIEDPYKAAKDLGLLEVIPSLNESTEHSVHQSMSRASSVMESEPEVADFVADLDV